MELELEEREASVGEFSLDLLATDLGTGRTVVIENQFGVTDHDHLGKLLTYAGGFDAATIVWLGEKIREEHRQALEWLNRRTDADTQFFGVIAEILQIDDSKPAYNFRAVVFPNEWQKTRRGTKPVSSKSDAYRDYFQRLIGRTTGEASIHWRTGWPTSELVLVCLGLFWRHVWCGFRA